MMEGSGSGSMLKYNTLLFGTIPYHRFIFNPFTGSRYFVCVPLFHYKIFTRGAVAAFTADGSLPQETLDQLKARIKVPEISVVETVAAAPPKAAPGTPKAAPGTPKAGAFVPKAIIGAPKAAGGTTPNVPPAKRKMDDAAAAVADKKARLKDPAELRVFLELEIMRNSKVSSTRYLSCCECCGSRIRIFPVPDPSVADPGCLSRIRIFPSFIVR
jgi:hypothetical protein